MKAKDIRCKKCGGKGKLGGSYQDSNIIEGPFYIYCSECGECTLSWSLIRQAWKNWKGMNEAKTDGKRSKTRH